MRFDATSQTIIREAFIKNRDKLVGERRSRAVHAHVELARRSAEQQVAHGTADQLDVLVLLRDIEQLATARQLAHGCQQPLPSLPLIAHVRPRDAGRPQPIRTGMPAAARCALASAIVWRP
jgi:hypothetical protein